jgi:hypothetical protein
MARFTLNRRAFLMSLISAPFALVSALAWAARKTVTTTEADATKALVKETDAMPAALKYNADAKKAAGRTNKSAVCSNCMQYAHAVDASGKDIKVKGAAVGSCALFAATKGYVTADGWCMSWFQAPAA